jgi:2-polyprenyl-6-methoxyphenol hydroxylase-like FAD-dependent oxidoreductase
VCLPSGATVSITLKTQPLVLIVGAGPTGMTAAMELARLNVPVRLIEKASAPATTSRALGVQARTLELFQQRGLVREMLDRGNKGLGGSIYGNGKRIFRLDYANNGSRYPFILLVSQANTESILRNTLAAQGVGIEREVELIALSQSEHGETVRAVLRHPDGSLEELNCDYLIDCEGAHSVARTTLNVQFAGKTRPETYVLADVHFEGELPDSDFHIFSSEHGFMGMFPLGAGHFRLIASNPRSTPGSDAAPSMREIQQIYEQRSHIPGRFHDMTWSSWFRINSRMVDKMRVGRVFLGGDAAHIHSPAGAQGMNTGIQDMINLSRKLAMVIHGAADPKLLDTYEQDRLPVIRNVLSKTEGLTDAIGSEDRFFRFAFAYVAPVVVGLKIVEQRSTEQMSQLSLNYRDSPLSTTISRVGAIHAGDRIPDVSNLLSLLDTDRFTLLCTNLSSPEAIQDAVRAKLKPWKDLLVIHSIHANEPEVQAFHEVFGKEEGLVLVRPDGYAAFTGSSAAMDELAHYLGDWLAPRLT